MFLLQGQKARLMLEMFGTDFTLNSGTLFGLRVKFHHLTNECSHLSELSLKESLIKLYEPQTGSNLTHKSHKNNEIKHKS